MLQYWRNSENGRQTNNYINPTNAQEYLIKNYPWNHGSMHLWHIHVQSLFQKLDFEIIILIIHIYTAHYSHCALRRVLKTNTVIPLLNTHRPYTVNMKVFKVFLNIVMESVLWIFRVSSFHNLAAEVPKVFLIVWIYFYMAQVM